jgi:hypothetical protein
MWKNWRKDFRDWAATIAGFITAGLVGWQNIDWSTFNLERDKTKLLIMFAIAAGGLFSKFKKSSKKEDKPE